MKLVPLNGAKTHALSAHALAELRRLANYPVAAQEVNPGVVNRLMREDLVELVQMPSPYVTHHRERKINHLRITAAGRSRLAEFEERP